MTQISDVSIMLFPWGVTPPTVSEIVDAAKLAENLGFYSVTLPTHMTLPPGWLFEDFPNRHVLDALVVVPAIAAATSRKRNRITSARRTLPALSRCQRFEAQGLTLRSTPTTATLP